MNNKWCDNLRRENQPILKERERKRDRKRGSEAEKESDGCIICSNKVNHTVINGMIAMKTNTPHTQNSTTENQMDESNEYLRKLSSFHTISVWTNILLLNNSDSHQPIKMCVSFLITFCTALLSIDNICVMYEMI